MLSFHYSRTTHHQLDTGLTGITPGPPPSYERLPNLDDWGDTQPDSAGRARVMKSVIKDSFTVASRLWNDFLLFSFFYFFMCTGRARVIGVTISVS
jgi:hypothetical protein